MRLDHISLHNFFNHADTEIDFSEINGPVLLNGTNGAGKTSAVVESLSYALFGETRLSDIDDAIRNNENDMSVYVSFLLNGQYVEIKRSKKRGKGQKLELTIDGTKIEELLSETQKKIDKLIGLSFDTFRSSVLLKQDDSNFFVKSKPDERKKIIGEILDLHKYERLEKVSKERRLEVKNEIKTIQTLLNNFEEFDIVELKKDLASISEFMSAHGQKLQKAEKKLAEVNEWNSKVDEEIKRYKQIEINNRNVQSKISSLKESIKTKESNLATIKKFLKENNIDIDGDIDSLRNAIKKHDELIAKYNESISDNKQKYAEVVNEKLSSIQNEIHALSQEIALLESKVKTEHHKLNKIHAVGEADCPTCQRPMAGNEISDIVHDLEESISASELELSKLNINKQKLDKSKEVIKSGNFNEAKSFAEILIKDNELLQIEKKALISKKSELEDLISKQQKVAVANERLNNLQESIIDEANNLNFLETQVQELPQLTLERIDDEQIKQKVTSLKKQEVEGIEAQANIKNSIAKAEKDAERKNAYIEKLRHNQHQLQLLDRICIAFSKNGIPSSIIETVLPEIQETANFYLEKMSDSSFEIAFSTIATLKNGEEKSTLDIAIFDGNIWRTFESLSGGEAFRVSLSIRLALSKILARRAGVELDLLILDEPASSLDAEGREAFCSTVKSLNDSFSRIIIISHIPQLADEFDNKINLNKTQAGTIIV